MANKKHFLGLLVLIPLATLLPGPSHTNPPLNPAHDFQSAHAAPPQVAALVRRACYDCHSNETRWPWYSHVAPLSWMMARDVEHGRRVINFSEWTTQTGRRPEMAVGALLAACEAVRSGEMPKRPYPMLHPEARLQPADIQVFCGWTTAEARRLMAIRASR